MKLRTVLPTLLLAGVVLGGAAHAQSPPPGTAPRGEANSGSTRALEAGAKLLQSNAPLKGFDICLNGFHPITDWT